MPRLAQMKWGWMLVALLAGSSVRAATVDFGQPVQISATGATALGPDIALDSAGGIHLLWVEKAPAPAADAANNGPNHNAGDDLFYRRSLPGGQGFTAPVKVNGIPGEVWGFAISKPVLDVGVDGTIHVLYPANAVQAGSGKAILVARYTRSTDGGKTFEAGRTLNSAATNDLSAVMHGGFAAAHSFGTLVASGMSDVHVYWVDTRFMTEKDTAGSMFGVDSRDSGKTFSDDRLIYSQVCPCCQFDATARGEKVLIATRQVFPEGYRDSAVAVSTNRGASFNDRVRVGEGRWKIEGCPLKRTVIAMDGDHVYTAWFTGGQKPAGVFFARSLDGGRRFQPSVAVHPAAAVSDAPTIAAAPGGIVLLAWHAKAGAGRRVFMKTSADGGATFSDVVEVPAPAGTAASPEIIMAPDAKTAFLTWQQDQAAYGMQLKVTATTPSVSQAY